MAEALGCMSLEAECQRDVRNTTLILTLEFANNVPKFIQTFKLIINAYQITRYMASPHGKDSAELKMDYKRFNPILSNFDANVYRHLSDIYHFISRQSFLDYGLENF